MAWSDRPSLKDATSVRAWSFTLALAIILLAVAGCSRQGRQASLADKAREVVVMRGFHMVQTDLGVKKYTIDADEANINPRVKLISFKDVKTVYFDKEKVVADLRSDTGSIRTDTSDIEVTGKVVLKTVDGSRLETESLSWSSAKNKLKTEAFVKVFRGENVMSGYGMESDLMLENVTIKKVTTRISDLETFKEKGKK